MNHFKREGKLYKEDVIEIITQAKKEFGIEIYKSREGTKCYLY